MVTELDEEPEEDEPDDEFPLELLEPEEFELLEPEELEEFDFELVELDFFAEELALAEGDALSDDDAVGELDAATELWSVAVGSTVVGANPLAERPLAVLEFRPTT